MEQLSTEQVLLLNNLMYMDNTSLPPSKDMADYVGMTVGDLVNNIDTGELKNDIDYTKYTNGDEWKKLIESVRSDDKLCSTRIVAHNVDEKGGMSILFHNTTDNEAVVVYRGTSTPDEWKDNFEGGSVTNQPDGVSTEQQQSAWEWYRSLPLEDYDSITVSGHSKGGNKAKYITIMDDSVDRCLSYDGQGFSDEFIDRYGEKIAANQYKIHNHNVDGDYVSILLNDVGDATYYKGYNYGDGKFLENHCPNTYMNYDKNGNFSLVETSQNQDVQNLDKFLNNYLRSIPQDERRDILNLIGTMVEQAQKGESGKDLLETFTNGSNTDSVAKLLAYFIKYTQQNPEMADSIRNILEAMGYGAHLQYVDIVEDILNSKYWDAIVDVADWISGIIPDGLLSRLSKYLKMRYNIELSTEQLRKLLNMIHTVNKELGHIQINDNGEDCKVKDTHHTNGGGDIIGGVGNQCFMVRPEILKNTVKKIQNQQRELAQIADKISSVRTKLDFHYDHYDKLNKKMLLQEQQVDRYEKNCGQLVKVLQEIAQKYEDTENRILQW